MAEKKDKPQKDLLNKDEELKESDQETARRLKMEKLVQEGIDVFPRQVKITHSIFEVVEKFSMLSREELEEKKVKVKVAGRIISVSYTHLTLPTKRIV